ASWSPVGALAARARALREAVDAAWPDDAVPAPDLEVRRADATDVDAAFGVIARCRDALAAAGVPQWDAVYPTRADVAADVAAGTLFVARRAGRVVGAVAADGRQDAAYADVPWRGAEPALVVHRLVVDPDVQGGGIGSALMAHVEALAARHGYASVRLDAYTGNPGSAALYRRRGYHEAGQVRFPRRPLPFHCFERDVARRP
ncbi:GNAT family N-acetyltransferase, partial [Roseisolibacter sp. H3M3-2]|uniref:GNAT family N-acetyltransferase n=1 Tax=Roseisolibacter sp. H3M3-2 TaxID=3031323 RepID=UPI0023DA86AD